MNKNNEFLLLVNELLKHPDIQKLEYYSHHIGTTRLQHSLNVAFISYKTAKFLKFDYKSALRGALLHDLFFYDYKEKGIGIIKHSALHPKIALKNASKICELNKIEKDIILKHMWLANYKFPRYKESYIVTVADKFCAICEATYGIIKKMKRKNIQYIN